MLDNIRLLHKIRQQRATIGAEIKQSREVWELEMADAFSDMHALDHAIAQTEEQLKTERVRTYNGIDKGKVYGVAIREVTKLHYSDDAAFQWAKNHELALKLDKKQFEKIAKIDTLEFVTITTEPQATIAQDLSEYVKGE